MTCDKLGCKHTQRWLHHQIGAPPVYYCCVCNGCAIPQGDEDIGEYGAYEMCAAVRENYRRY